MDSRKQKNNGTKAREKLSDRLFGAGIISIGLSLLLYGGDFVCGIVRPMFKTEIPALTGRVVDAAHVMGSGDVARVTEEIAALESATHGGQMAVLTVPSIGNEPIEDFSLKVAEAWKIGRKGKDNGAVLVIAAKDHKDRLEIGYGWEGAVNDARAGDILREMVPFLRANDYAGAALLAVRRVKGFVTGEAGVEPLTPRQSEEPMDWMSTSITVLFCLGILLLLVGGGLDPRKYKSGGTRGRNGDGGWSSHASGGGGFSGGGGSFGGGGASGRW